jgi:dipeptidyl-peptidase 4
VRRALSFFSLLCLTCSLAAQESHKQLTIEAIFAPGGLTGREPEATYWTPDNANFSYIDRDDSGDNARLWLVNAENGAKRVLVGPEKLAQLAPAIEKLRDDREKDQIQRYHVAPYRWAPDSKHILFTPRGQLWYYDLDSGTAVQISVAPEPSRDPKFSPDGKSLAYVREHNLYVQPITGGSPKQLTHDKDGKILNGEVDWVYAEELSVRSNYFWSPEGGRIAFLQMDETLVPTYPITDWMPTHPKVDEQRYPQPGDPNPTVRIGVISSSGGRVKWLSFGADGDIYIPRFNWINKRTLWAEVLNRAQDKLDLYFIDADSGKARKMLTESAPDAWVNVSDDFNALETKGEFLWTSWRDGHTHIYLYSYERDNPLASDAQLERQLTHGDFEVLGIASVDENDGAVYFICNQGDPRQQQLYSVKLDGSAMQRLSREAGFHDPTFNENEKFYLDNYSATLSPPRYSVCDPVGSCRPFFESRSVAEYGLIQPQQLQFKAEDGSTLYGYLLRNPKQDPGARLPLVVYVYGGPAGQTVLNKWNGEEALFHQLLAHSGFAIFSVDNRGTPGRSRAFQAAIRHQFGEIELRDQIAALDQLLAAHPDVDKDRIAIWGWSNGGTMTLYALTHSDRFRAGASVAPVSDWRNYDSIYTERYLGLLSENQRAYSDSSLPAWAGKLRGALLLAHGTEDDNVHFQNSIQMADALVRAGKQFRFMPYPNKTHAIAGPEYRAHLFHMIQDHFERELK